MVLSYWIVCCRLFVVFNVFDGNIFCEKYVRSGIAGGNLIVNVDQQQNLQTQTQYKQTMYV